MNKFMEIPIKDREFLTSFNARFVLNYEEIRKIKKIIKLFRELGIKKKIELAASILWLIDNNRVRTIDDVLYLIMIWKKNKNSFTDRYTIGEFFNVWKELAKIDYIPTYINTNCIYGGVR